MNTEARAHSTALLEELQVHVKVIAEGHGALTQRLDEADARLAGIEGRFAQLELQVVRSTKRPKRVAKRSSSRSGAKQRRVAR